MAEVEAVDLGLPLCLRMRERGLEASVPWVRVCLLLQLAVERGTSVLAEVRAALAERVLGLGISSALGERALRLESVSQVAAQEVDLDVTRMCCRCSEDSFWQPWEGRPVVEAEVLVISGHRPRPLQLFSVRCTSL